MLNTEYDLLEESN